MRIAPIATVLILTTGCGGAGTASSAADGPAASAEVKKSPAQPKTEAAVKKAARETFDSYSSGDYGDSWDTWTAAAQKYVTRANYAKAYVLCPSIVEGIPFKITSIKMSTNSTSAKVRTMPIVNISSSASYLFVYEAGEWRWAPTKDILSDYKAGLTPRQVAAKWRKSGRCAKA